MLQCPRRVLRGVVMHSYQGCTWQLMGDTRELVFAHSLRRCSSASNWTLREKQGLDVDWPSALWELFYQSFIFKFHTQISTCDITNFKVHFSYFWWHWLLKLDMLGLHTHRWQSFSSIRSHWKDSFKIFKVVCTCVFFFFFAYQTSCHCKSGVGFTNTQKIILLFSVSLTC